MTKLSKVAAKLHQQALDLVYSDKRLTLEDRHFILDNFQESANNLNGLAGAFFTPAGLAQDMAVEVPECGSLIDLCAGIGRLAFTCRDRAKRIVCVELNADYAAVGKRVLPEAEWVVSDAFSLEGLGHFDVAISNPPFGTVRTGAANRGRYTGASFEYKLIEVASKMADHGVFIVPQQSAPFRYSGRQSFSVEITEQCAKFMEQTGIHLDHNCGLDTSSYLNEWHGVSPMCEIVVCDFTETRAMLEEVTIEALVEIAVEPVLERPMVASTPVLASVAPVAPAPVVTTTKVAPTARAKRPSRNPVSAPAASAQLSLFDAA